MYKLAKKTNGYVYCSNAQKYNLRLLRNELLQITNASLLLGRASLAFE
jgi:hypothetical protein